MTSTGVVALQRPPLCARTCAPAAQHRPGAGSEIRRPLALARRWASVRARGLTGRSSRAGEQAWELEEVVSIGFALKRFTVI